MFAEDGKHLIIFSLFYFNMITNPLACRENLVATEILCSVKKVTDDFLPKNRPALLQKLGVVTPRGRRHQGLRNPRTCGGVIP